MTIKELIRRLKRILKVEDDNMEVKVLIGEKYIALANNSLAVRMQTRYYEDMTVHENITVLRIESEGDENDSI